MQFCDAHSHLCTPPLCDNYDAIVERSSRMGLRYLLDVAIDKKSFMVAREARKRHPSIFIAGAIPPQDTPCDLTLDAIADAAQKKELSAIGETGLDRQSAEQNLKVQKERFQEHCALALSYHLPLILHVRNTFEEVKDVLQKHYFHKKGERKGMVHCFTGTVEEMEYWQKKGWYVSFSGIITYKSGQTLLPSAQKIASQQLLCETDSPYLTPGKKRTFPNVPENIITTITALAKVRKCAAEAVAHTTTENLLRFLDHVKTVTHELTFGSIL